MLRLVAALHARGFHPAVLAGLVMMPAVVLVGFFTDLRPLSAETPAIADTGLRGSFNDFTMLRGTGAPSF